MVHGPVIAHTRPMRYSEKFLAALLPLVFVAAACEEDPEVSLEEEALTLNVEIRDLRLDDDFKFSSCNPDRVTDVTVIADMRDGSTRQIGTVKCGEDKPLSFKVLIPLELMASVRAVATLKLTKEPFEATRKLIDSAGPVPWSSAPLVIDLPRDNGTVTMKFKTNEFLSPRSFCDPKQMSGVVLFAHFHDSVGVQEIARKPCDEKNTSISFRFYLPWHRVDSIEAVVTEKDGSEFLRTPRRVSQSIEANTKNVNTSLVIDLTE